MKFNKVTLVCTLSLMAVVGILLAADTVKITRFTRGMLVQGGTSSTTGSSVVVSDSTTNEYKIVLKTATVAAAVTSYTNTFTTAFVATPTVVFGVPSGITGLQQTNLWSVGATITTTGIVVTGLSTNASNGINNLPIIIYGYQRTGILE